MASKKVLYRQIAESIEKRADKEIKRVLSLFQFHKINLIVRKIAFL